MNRVILRGKFLGLFFYLFLGISILKAQSPQLPNVIPPSPTAQNFMRYGEIPIDHSTGVPNIEVPLYTIRGKKLEVPISLSYHASGIKVRDVASEVGLGWVLNAGGMVSRSVNGKPDGTSSTRTFFNSEELNEFIYLNAWNYDPAAIALTEIMNFEYFLNGAFTNEEDQMSDRYFYKLPGVMSGVFTYDYSVLNGGDVITLPYRPYKIERIQSGTTALTGFKITDDNGTSYTFRSHGQHLPQFYSEWLLEEMVSADRTDTITFYYKQQAGNYLMSSESFAYRRVLSYDYGCTPNNFESSTSISYSTNPDFKAPVLEKIVSAEAIVEFQYAGREDFNGLDRLTEITISPKDAPNKILKQIQLVQGYFGTTSENKRLGLNNLVISAPGDSEPQKYSFVYEDQVLPPYPYKMVARKYSEDYWGYYNGVNDSDFIPIDFILNSSDKSSFGANRKPDPSGYYSKACMLKEIRYPTGGKTAFAFERNYADYVFPFETYPEDRNGFVGGFRIGNVTNFNEYNEVVSVKTYEYKQPVVRPVARENFFYTQVVAEKKHFPGDGASIPPSWCWAEYTREMVFSDPVVPLEVAPGLPVMYREVVEYNGTKSVNSGKTVYKYDAPYSPSDYNHPDHPYEYEAPWYYHPYHYDKGNFVPEMTSKEVYSYDGTDYYPVSEEKYTYSKLFTKAFNTGIKLSRLKIYTDPTYFVVHCGTNPLAANCDGLIREYIESLVAIDTKAYQEASLLTKVESYVFHPQASSQRILTYTNYTYNEANLAVSEKSTMSSEGEILKTIYTYPHDVKPIQPYQLMFDKQILSPIIEEDYYKVSQQSNKLISKVKTQYKEWGNNIIEPEYIIVQCGSAGLLESRINYLSYDSDGNVTSVRKEDDTPVTYIWGYNGLYPVAEVVGEDYATVSALVDLNLLANASEYSDEQVRTELNKIRVALESSGHPFSLTTYTYRLGVGMTSRTDSRGTAVFYEYDSFGRLLSIKDHKTDIIKTYEYHHRK